MTLQLLRQFLCLTKLKKKFLLKGVADSPCILSSIHLRPAPVQSDNSPSR